MEEKQVKKKKPFYKRWWFILIIVLLAIGIIGSLGEEDVNTSSETSGSNVSDANNTSSTEASKSDVKKEENTILSVGEVGTVKNVSATLKEVVESAGSAYNKPTDGNVFVLCEFEIENNSDSELNISSMLSFDAYCDGYSTSLSLGALIENESKQQLDGTIAPGKKMKGLIGYELPKDWKELEINFMPSVFIGKKLTYKANK